MPLTISPSRPLVIRATRRLAAFAALCLAATSTLSAAVWHVAGDGDDTRAGTSPETAFRTLQHAAARVTAGDVVLIGDGVYTATETGHGSAVLTIAASGRPDAWITWKARPGTRPELRPVGWTGILVTGSYHLIEGLTVIGGNDSIFLQEAIMDARNPTANPRFNTNGIFVNGRSKSPAEKPHHVIIRNCTVGKCGGGGITAIEADYITVEDCKVYENAWYMRYAGSGITLLNNWSFDQDPGYHIIIRRNIVWNNRCLVPWEKTGKLSDGNGILQDVTDLDGDATNPNGDKPIAINPTGDTASPASGPKAPAAPAAPPKPQRPEWHGRTLIANNLSAHNGGSGIHTFRTKRVDIINNTTYGNGQTVGYQEIFANRSEDVVILNNIMIPRPGGKVTSNNRNTNVRWDFNLYPGEAAVIAGPNDIIADPGFIDLQPDPTRGDLRLKPGSPGLDSGTNDLAQPTDLRGNPRPAGRARDRGAFEQ